MAGGQPGAARRAPTGPLRPDAGAASPERPAPATAGPAPLAPRRGLRLSARRLAAADCPPRSWPHPARHQPDRVRHPPQQARAKELVIRRSSRRRRPARRHLLAPGLGPAPRSRSSRLSQGRAHAPADDDHQGRSGTVLSAHWQAPDKPWPWYLRNQPDRKSRTYNRSNPVPTTGGTAGSASKRCLQNPHHYDLITRSCGGGLHPIDGFKQILAMTVRRQVGANQRQQYRIFVVKRS